jgi:hypothetical protein
MFQKKWYTSKTMWFNLLSVALVIVQYSTDTKLIPLETQVFLVSLINIFLRSISNKHLTR